MRNEFRSRQKQFLTLHQKRRIVQLAVAVAFIVIPILNRSRYSYVYGNFLAFHIFGIPLADPLAILQLTIRNLYLTVDNVIGALLPLLLAVMLGTVFCSWICPYGLLSELVQSVRRRIRPAPPLASHNGFAIKMVIFLVGFGGFFIFSTTPVLNQLSMPAWYSRFFQYYFGQDFISLCFLFILAVLAIEFLVGCRLWCRYICPQSVLINLIKQLNPRRLRVHFNEERCICRPGYERCLPACTLQLNAKTIGEVREFECSNCGDCVVACAKMGQALRFEWIGRRDMAMVVQRFVVGLVALAVAVTAGWYGYQTFQQYRADQAAKAQLAALRQTSQLLADHRLAFSGDAAEFYELLSNGTVVFVGGQWPVNGFKGYHWQAVGNKGGFRVLNGQEEVMRVEPESEIGLGATVRLIHHDPSGLETDTHCTVSAYAPLGDKDHEAQATTLNATSRLLRYSGEVYEQQLRVQDPEERLVKILSEGDAITNEVMLTSVKYWLNTPPIVVSEGTKPNLPLHTRMTLLFRDGHTEQVEFSTSRIEDMGEREFEDPWF